MDTSWFAAPRPDPRVHQPAGPAMIEPGPESHASALGNPGAVCVCVCVCGGRGEALFTAEEGAAPCPDPRGHPQRGPTCRPELQD